MDGLLVDTEPLWIVAMQEVFETIGVSISPELAAQTTGLQTAEVVNHWYEYFKWEGKSKEQVCTEIMESIAEKVLTRGRSMEGMEYALDFFKQRNIKMGLASSSPAAFINLVLDHFRIKHYFSAVSSAEYEVLGKPHPAVYLSCAQKLGSNPLNCLAFEDSINGMIAAKAARMKVVAVPEAHNWNNPKYALADLQLRKLSDFNTAWFDQLSGI